MSIIVSDTQASELFAAQTEARPQRVRTLAAAIVREYEGGTAADKATINAIVDELLVLVPAA